MESTGELVGTLEPSSSFLQLSKEQWQLLLLVLMTAVWPSTAASSPGAVAASALGAHLQLHAKTAAGKGARLVTLEADEVGSLITLLRSA